MRAPAAPTPRRLIAPLRCQARAMNSREGMPDRNLNQESRTRPYPAGGDHRLQDMDDDVDDFEPVVSRLHSVGQQPVDHALQQRVLARAHRSRTTWLRSTKVKVAAALAGGFMIGS